MTYTLPITCTQLCAIVLVGCFIAGNAILMPIDYGMEPFPSGFFGWLLTACAVVFGLVMFIVYVFDSNIIRCKCNK